VGPGTQSATCPLAHREHTTNIDDLILVSVDDHVVEPPDVFYGTWDQ
jgi:hypothetical protein